MALTTAITQEELGRVSDLAFNGKTFTMALLNHSVAPATDDGICAWLAAEVNGNGYARFQRTIAANGSYDSGTDARWELPDQDFTFTASSGTIVYTHAVILYGAAATGLIGTVAADAAVDPSTNRITVTSHGMVNGTKVTVRAEVGGTLPTGLTSGGTYYLKSIDGNTIELYSNSNLSTVVDITADGTGNMSVINAAGSVHSVWSESPSRSILSGASYTYRWSPYVND